MVVTVNEQLSRVEQIKYYRVIGTSWTPDSGEITPTLKLRRKVVAARYADTIERMYAAESGAKS